MLRTHCQTSGVEPDSPGPYNNVVRTTIEAMAATSSAARSRCTPTPWTRPSPCPPSSAARIARNTQLILQEETGITQRRRSLGRARSYIEEKLTHDLADKAWEHHRGGRGPGRHDQGGRSSGMGQAADRGGRRPQKQARIDSGAQDGDRRRQQVPQAGQGRPDRHSETWTTSKVRDAQIARLEQVSGPRVTGEACRRGAGMR